MLRKGEAEHAKFLIRSQIFKWKLRVVTRRPDLGKTDSINRLALNPCYCAKAVLAPWSPFNFESLLSENNGMSANLVPTVQKDFNAACARAVTPFALGRNCSAHVAAVLTGPTRGDRGDALMTAQVPLRSQDTACSHRGPSPG